MHNPMLTASEAMPATWGQADTPTKTNRASGCRPSSEGAKRSKAARGESSGFLNSKNLSKEIRYSCFGYKDGRLSTPAVSAGAGQICTSVFLPWLRRALPLPCTGALLPRCDNLPAGRIPGLPEMRRLLFLPKNTFSNWRALSTLLILL